MDDHFNHLVFSDGLAEFSRDCDIIARVPDGIFDREQLFTVLSRELNLPPYFGRNWDALSECLRDLSWLDRRRVIIAHEAVPSLGDDALRAYLDVLLECTSDWKPDEEHELLCVFPEHAKAKILGILGRTR